MDEETIRLACSIWPRLSGEHVCIAKHVLVCQSCPRLMLAKTQMQPSSQNVQIEPRAPLPVSVAHPSTYTPTGHRAMAAIGTKLLREQPRVAALLLEELEARHGEELGQATLERLGSIWLGACRKGRAAGVGMRRRSSGARDSCPTGIRYACTHPALASSPLPSQSTLKSRCQKLLNAGSTELPAQNHTS